MIDHLSLGVSDLARALAFYDALLAPLGHARLWTREDAAGWGPPGAADEPFAVYLSQRAASGARAAGNGSHLAFTAPSRQAVDAFHAAALALGGSDEGAPALRPRYGADYYAAFVRCPDGHKLEAVCHKNF
jgi:catechol 2,3-dioxygenase-like lactoylglutathione lyase family enzyme